ncbi:caspase-9-like isoform X2 [Portunus trituberculatus]|nr:caspase-9-like isoform X2 [Portunus trituberculatus]
MAEASRLVRQGTPLEGLVNKRSPLMRAAMGNRVAMVRALLDMGASVDFKNEDGWTALHIAAKHDAVAVAEALLDAGADIEARSNSGRTPLALACNQKKLSMAKKLLERGADASTTDGTGWTLLFQAVRSGSLEVVRWLVEEVGVDPRCASGGKTAKQLADSKGHAHVSRYLDDAIPDISGSRTATKASHSVMPASRTPRLASKLSAKAVRASESFLDDAGAVVDLKVRLTRHVVPPGPDVYDTTTDPPGLVLLLNYITFSGSDIKDRQGAEYDTINIKSVFKQMGYEVEAYEDLTWKDTMLRIKEFSTSGRLNKAGCAVVVVSSHGGTDPSSFLTSDGEQVSVSHLHQSFKDYGKDIRQMAKIFFLQFCRGDVLPVRETDYSLDRSPKNIISFYSTSDGFVAYRDPRRGSIFLSVVCEVLAERAYKNNLDDLYRQVQRRYVDRGLGTTPEMQNLGFSKKFYFNPRPRK